MSKVQMVRALVQQRLTAAAEEIFVLFERTIAEYEEELCRSKEENERQQKLLEAVFNPQLQMHRKFGTDVQHLSVSKEEVPSEQQERSSSLDQDQNQDQEDPEPPHVKEEQEEVWSRQEGEQLPRPEEADLELSSISVLVKSEQGTERKTQTLQLCEIQAEENKEAEHLESAINSDPDSPLQPGLHEPETDDSGDLEETKEPQSGLNSSQNDEIPHADCNAGKTSVIVPEFVGNFDQEGNLQKNNGIHKQPLSCSVCGKTFAIRSSLTMHLRVCLHGKSFTCSICNQSFGSSSHLVRHMVIHTGEKPFSCSVCGKRFTLNQNLKRHLIVHTGEKPFSCSVCGTRFSRKTHLKRHLSVHTAEKPFSCSVCGNRYARKTCLTRHLIVHTGEKSFT